MTRIKWKQDTELQVMENECDSYNEIIRTGEMDDVDIVEDKGDTVDMQFPSGDVAFSVSKDLFEEAPE